jgi:hypothetical protein
MAGLLPRLRVVRFGQNKRVAFFAPLSLSFLSGHSLDTNVSGSIFIVHTKTLTMKK